jgi:hypothetical protein
MTAPTSSATTVVTYKAAIDSPLAVPASGEPQMAVYEAHELAHGTPKAVKNEVGTEYGFVLSDQGKVLTFTNGSAITATIPANASVEFPIGTEIDVYQGGAGQVTIAITSDTMRLAGAGTTGNRTLAANGVATAIKVTATEWIISGSTGLT